MTIIQEIEQLRRTRGLNMLMLCNALMLSSESEYWEIIHNNKKLSTMQKICFMDVFRISLKSI